MRWLALLLLLPLVPFAGCSSDDTTVTAPQCISLSRDGTETDVDCGGDECPPCPAGRACLVDTDCRTGNCEANICRAPGPVATCTDGVMNDVETDVDCGGVVCDPCDVGEGCKLGTDCASGLCTNGACSPPATTCTDGAKNGDETDVDCGGGACPQCADGAACGADTDCLTSVCDATGHCIDPVDACSDGTRDGTETDTDCGGAACPKCEAGGACQGGGDCASGTCTNNVCG